ncbi:hypothetical protein M0R45_010691 [Rubus argutus]|uniref:Uncharacterized protein n=1 Tax=Rubus argutus TaxID=59490 RepID=A0AAW1YB44_RUBAR
MCKLKNKTLLIVILVVVCLLVILAASAARPLQHDSSGRMMTQMSTTSFGAKSKAKAASSPFLDPQAKGDVPPGGPNPGTNIPKRSNGHY